MRLEIIITEMDILIHVPQNVFNCSGTEMIYMMSSGGLIGFKDENAGGANGVYVWTDVVIGI
jgi:hypothetical protein